MTEQVGHLSPRKFKYSKSRISRLQELQTSALAFGEPPASAATEEWTGAGTNNSYNHSFLTFTLSF
jgi:hypothetical protein